MNRIYSLCAFVATSGLATTALAGAVPPPPVRVSEPGMLGIFAVGAAAAVAVAYFRGRK